jgi:hypothetical protein
MAMAVAVVARHMAKRMIAGAAAVVMDTKAARMIAEVVVAAANTRVAQMIAGVALDGAGLMRGMGLDPRHWPKMLHGSESLSFLPGR